MILINVQGIGKRYAQDAQLADISFEISEKGIYGFLSKNSEEKNELARILAGISCPDAGEIFYKETAMFASSKQTASLKRKIGYVPERCFFDEDMTVMEVLDFIGRARGVEPDKRFRQIKEALDLTGLSKKIKTLVAELSISEKKKLAIAAALLGNPDNVIMVDPLRSVDRAQAEDIRSLITLLGKKKVLLLFCSRPSDIEELCSHVAIIAEGNLALWGEVEEILQKLRAEGFSGISDALDAFSYNGEES